MTGGQYAEYIPATAAGCRRCFRPLDRAAVLCESDLCTDCERYAFARAAQKAKRQALRQVNARARVDHRARIDAAIRRAAATGAEFSANDIRRVLEDVPGPVIGARFNAAAKAGFIERVGYVASTKVNTHGHPIALWRAAA